MENEVVNQELRVLEERFAMPAAESRESLAALLAEDFREYGSSGRVYGAAETLQAISADGFKPRLVFENFQAVPVAPDMMLVTYMSRSVSGPGWKRPAPRSSLWRWRDDRWQLVFHQGTRLASDSEAAAGVPLPKVIPPSFA
jgi:hypothetical protein